MVVSASRSEQLLRDALPATTLISRADIERLQALDVPSVLRQVAGVEVVQSGGSGTQSSVFVRGAESRHTLVLIDGMPVNNLNFSTVSLEHLPLANVERIEIVRGNVSSLYGSSALGGVIQIFTRRAAGAADLNVTVQAGSRGFIHGQAAGTVQLAPGTRAMVVLESLADEGFNATDNIKRPGTNPDLDGYQRRSASLALQQEVGRGALALNVRESRSDARYDSEFGPATQADASISVLRGAGLTVNYPLADSLWLDAGWTTASDRLNAEVTAYPYFVNSTTDTTALGLGWKPASGHAVTAGLESTRQGIESNTRYRQSGRQLDSSRMGYQGELGNHQLQVNARQDRYTDFGSATTWYGGYAYRLSDAWRIHASTSTGFAAPTFNDLYYPFGGNAALRPEQLRSREAGVQYATRQAETRMVWFQNQYADLIGNDSSFTRVNISRARNEGVELSFRGNLGPSQVQASLTSQDPVNEATGQRLSRRAAVLGQLGVSTRTGAWTWGANLRHQGDRTDGNKALAAYSVLDLKASRGVGGGWTVFGRIDNLLDARYETVYGYAQPPLGVFLGATWQSRR